MAFLVQSALSVGVASEGNQDSASVPLRTSIMCIGLLHNDVVFSESELSKVSFGGATCFGRGLTVINNSMVCEACLEGIGRTWTRPSYETTVVLEERTRQRR